MEFGTVIVLVVLIILPVAAVLFAGAFGLLEDLGKGGLSLEEAPPTPAPPPQSAAARIEREAEIRQMLQARHDRQAARGEQPIDVDAEVDRLLEANDPGSTAERHDSALREEVRQLVVARNERRMARGEPALDVEAEVDRQLRELT